MRVYLLITSILIVPALFNPGLFSQRLPVTEFRVSEFDSDYYGQFEKNKQIPSPIRQQALIALSFFPELKEVPIVFRYRKRKTPLTSRPRIGHVFRRRAKRTYVITISNRSNARLEPILLNRLPYNAQIGVLGHELSHIAFYQDKSSFGLLGLTSMLFDSKKTDGFEFHTDRVCIEHGLGYQLLEWSTYVRQVLDIKAWKGVKTKPNQGKYKNIRQRYMDPQTILKYMELNPIYR